MAIRPIVRFPDPRLRQKAEPVDDIDEDARAPDSRIRRHLESMLVDVGSQLTSPVTVLTLIPGGARASRYASTSPFSSNALG